MLVPGHPTRREVCHAALVALATPRWLFAERSDSTPHVFLEAESFQTRGGWVLDQQSMDQMGSPYLLAHGQGRPVADAKTKVTFPKKGRYRAWVRTRDWCGPWKQPDTPEAMAAHGSPGRFHVQVDGQSIGGVVGDKGALWHWQEAGYVDIASREAVVSLRDLTGFDGRCEAVLLTMDERFCPPDDARELAALRRQRRGSEMGSHNVARFDFVVVGGGVAGLCAAVAASRLGLKVALVHDRPVLGGNSSSEIRVSPGSVRNVPPYDRLGDVMAEFEADRRSYPQEEKAFLEADKAKRRLVEAERNITLLVNHHVFRVGMEGSRIRSVTAADTSTGQAIRLEASLFADCSGDANLGALAGADFRVGRESRAVTGEPRAPEKGDRQVLGSTLHWYSEQTEAAAGFPDCPWALPFNERTCQWAVTGAWNWETGFRRDQVAEAELIRDYMLRAIYGNWSYQINTSSRKMNYGKRRLKWVGYVLGKRESRRLLGDVIYSQIDLNDGTDYPDNCVACNWGIDVHVPDPKNAEAFGGRAFRAVHRHYDKGKAPMRWLPYRCLYSRNVDNLLMAGRNVSCTHLGFAWFRNQRTTGMMGEVIGMAASVCLLHDVSPRGVYTRHLDPLKKLWKCGAGKRT